MTIDERVARLERQNVRLRRIAIALGVCLLLTAGMGAMAMQNRNRITLEDQAGRLRIDLFVHPDFGPLIGFYDNNGKERIRVGSDQNDQGKPYIVFYGPQGSAAPIVKAIVP